VRLNLYKVGVFTETTKRGGHRFRAYVRTYSQEWKGCCVHEVETWSGDEAKRLAILDHRDHCIGGGE
jgi:hypothetical protein